jgi:hypothetical protein
MEYINLQHQLHSTLIEARAPVGTLFVQAQHLERDEH